MNHDGDFSRQSFLGAHSEALLANLSVTIIGLGGGGSHIAQQLAHAGVGRFRLIDPDHIEASNLNRLVGGTQADVDKKMSKVDIAERLIKSIRPWASVEKAQAKWQSADSLVRDGQIVFGCLDGYQQRDYLEAAARRFSVSYFDIGMDVTEIGDGKYSVAGQMIMSLPGGPCMRCLGFLTPERLAREENRYGDAGINPQVVWTNGMLASLAVGGMMKLILPWSEHREPYTWLEVEGDTQTVSPSRQPEYFPREAVCPHREGVGDPFFNLETR